MSTTPSADEQVEAKVEAYRRALSQELDHYYIWQELELGGDSQALPLLTEGEDEGPEEETAG